MKAKEQKKATQRTPEDLSNGAQKRTRPPPYPFYASNEDTHRLDAFVRYAIHLEEFKRLWSTHLGSSDREVDFSLAWISNKEWFNWLPESDLMRWVAVILAKGDVDALQRLTNAYKTYQEGWGDLSNKDLAKVHLMIACNSFWKAGHDRGEVTKAELKERARLLWAKFVCRGKRREPTPANIKREQRNLPHVDWPLILKEIGLDDIQPAKSGRKPIGNKTR